MVLLLLAVAAPVRVDLGRVEQVGEVEAPGFPVLDRRAGLELVHAPDHLVQAAEAELRHDLAQLLGHEAHEVDHVLGLALVLGTQLRVLRRDACGAGVQVADAHHDAARGHQRRGGEAELLGAE